MKRRVKLGCQKREEIFDAGNADKHLPSLLQIEASVFAQLRACMSTCVKAQWSATCTTSQQPNSRVLATPAARATEDPFAKVKETIKVLIVRLMDEANEEAGYKGRCDTKLSTNEQTSKEKKEAVETMYVKIDQFESSIANPMKTSRTGQGQ